VWRSLLDPASWFRVVGLTGMALLGTLDYVYGFVIFVRKYRVGGFLV
jgi:hypothetical protein